MNIISWSKVLRHKQLKGQILHAQSVFLGISIRFDIVVLALGVYFYCVFCNKKIKSMKVCKPLQYD